jgi:predicted aspartyl protease
MMVRRVMRLLRGTGAAFTATILLLTAGMGRCAVTLDALGLYLTRNGYGGAQLIRLRNFYHLPINSNGKPANLIIDTGAPATLIFRPSVKALGLNELKTKAQVSGAFGQSREFYGTAMIKSLAAGNCIFTNVPVAIIPPLSDSHRYGDPSGVLGLRELNKFGAVLDLPHRLIYFRSPRSGFDAGQTARLIRTTSGWKPIAPGAEVSQTMRSILTEHGWTAVPFSIVRRHLHVPATVNGVSCYLMVDTGAYFTILDANFAQRARIVGVPTHVSAEGIGKFSRDISLAAFPSLRVGSYEIKNGSATVGDLDPEAIGRGTDSEVAGLLGMEHLAMNSAIFDFVTRTMYLRSQTR